jgi:hypothetical protein
LSRAATTLCGVPAGGRACQGAANKFPLVRGKGTNTLTLVPGAIPTGAGREREQDGVGRAQHTESISGGQEEFDTASRERSRVPVTQAKQRESAKRERARRPGTPSSSRRSGRS